MKQTAGSLAAPPACGRLRSPFASLHACTGTVILHSMETNEELVTTGLAALGITPRAGDVERLVLHVAEVARTNRVMNLTSVPEQDYVALHVLDSLTALPFLEKAPSGAFADIGSGAGFPGIPLAVMSGRPVALVESVRKKAAFLEHASAAIRLEATVHAIRAEELAALQSESYAAVVARAVSALPALIELASPLLVQGGLLICMKGKRDSTELLRGEAAAALCGMVREQTALVHVPGVDADRTIIVYRKVGGSRVRLPRRTGLAQRQPLA